MMDLWLIIVILLWTPLHLLFCVLDYRARAWAEDAVSMDLTGNYRFVLNGKTFRYDSFAEAKKRARIAYERDALTPGNLRELF